MPGSEIKRLLDFAAEQPRPEYPAWASRRERLVIARAWALRVTAEYLEEHAIPHE